jgi:tRNA-specific adenosine deaminase 1
MQNGCKVTKPTEEESSSNDGSEIQNLIANCALDHYGKYITKGKPKDETEWTVYSAVIAQKERQLWVVSAATGTKCTAKRQEGCILHDVHAEVLARRGLVRVLWLELREKLHNMESTNNEKSLLEVVSAKDKRFRLGMNIRLHLYISDSPCGDAW